MNLTAQNVEQVFLQCLFEEGENTDNHVSAEGVRLRVGFNPERLKEHTPSIENFLEDLPDSFKSTGGGGMSFINACVDKDNNQWGEHSNIDQLICLGRAIGKLDFLMPREMWEMMPGGMPYIVVN